MVLVVRRRRTRRGRASGEHGERPSAAASAAVSAAAIVRAAHRDTCLVVRYFRYIGTVSAYRVERSEPALYCLNTVLTPVYLSQHFLSQHLFLCLNTCHLTQICVSTLIRRLCETRAALTQRRLSDSERCALFWCGVHQNENTVCKWRVTVSSELSVVLAAWLVHGAD